MVLQAPDPSPKDPYEQDLFEAVESLVERSPWDAGRLLVDGYQGLANLGLEGGTIGIEQIAGRLAFRVLERLGDGAVREEAPTVQLLARLSATLGDRPPDEPMPRGCALFPIIGDLGGQRLDAVVPLAADVSLSRQPDRGEFLGGGTPLRVGVRLYEELDPGESPLDLDEVGYRYLVFPRPKAQLRPLRPDLASKDISNAIAVLSALSGWRLPRDMVMTGSLGPAEKTSALDQPLRNVGDLGRKDVAVDAASHRQGRRMVMIAPAGQRAGNTQLGAADVWTIRSVLEQLHFPFRPKPDPLRGWALTSGIAAAVLFGLLHFERAAVPFEAGRTGSGVRWAALGAGLAVLLFSLSLVMARHAITIGHRIAFVLATGTLALVAAWAVAKVSLATFAGFPWTIDPNVPVGAPPQTEVPKDYVWYWLFVLVLWLLPASRFSEAESLLKSFRPRSAWRLLHWRPFGIPLGPLPLSAFLAFLLSVLLVPNALHWADRVPWHPYWKTHVYMQTIGLLVSCGFTILWLVLRHSDIRRRTEDLMHPVVFEGLRRGR